MQQRALQGGDREVPRVALNAMAACGSALSQVSRVQPRACSHRSLHPLGACTLLESYFPRSLRAEPLPVTELTKPLPLGPCM